MALNHANNVPATLQARLRTPFEDHDIYDALQKKEGHVLHDAIESMRHLHIELHVYLEKVDVVMAQAHPDRKLAKFALDQAVRVGNKIVAISDSLEADSKFNNTDTCRHGGNIYLWYDQLTRNLAMQHAITNIILPCPVTAG